MLKKYRTSDLLNYFGVPRDTLRFYEEKGLLNPKKNSENNYRNYDIFDIYNLMIIDFYKKRGMTIHQIQDLLNKSDVQDIQSLLGNKRSELEKIIYDAQCMLKRIEETQKFSRNLDSNLNTFTIKSLPQYRINGEVSDFIAVEEYENVKDIMNSNNDDMLSQIMRYISFDKNGVIAAKMLIVDTAEVKNENDNYLHYPKCLYTVVEEIQPQDEQEDLIKKMYRVSSEYANTHGLRLLGEAFAMIRLITYKVNKTKAYIEIFIPFE
ncbi:MerR family transcriptional regulator [Desnuesiella massiliensis]|uniref:MerR family transcriptional regulator n=1 Tax=Desnuesiella massiliensis TaxID=1650662 RepID=UPI0006E2900C|nr:MerR family transcriptional regulator [Desnuesiella massiliensis]